MKDQSALGPSTLHGNPLQCEHKMTEHKVPDLPPGPLDVYRKKASFNWKEMLIFLEGEEVLEFKQHIFRTLENDPLFARRPGEDVSMEKMRELTFLRYRPLLHFYIISTPCMTNHA
ncbi:hypothetical protein INR49_020378 [Caranx melampygus]|nr:hypothetical protein INR49_020378 [Caranx melampygus]